MKLTNDILKKLRREYRQGVEESVEFLLNGNVEKAKENLEKAQLYSQILGSQSHRSQRAWSFVLAFCCLLIAGFALVLRVPTTPVAIDLVAKGVAFSTVDPSFRAEVRGKECYVDNIDTIWSMNPLPKAPDQRAILISMKGRGIVLNDITPSMPVRLELEQSNDELAIYIKADTVRGTLSILEGSVELHETTRLIAGQKVPSVYFFEAFAPHMGNDPVKLAANTNVSWRLSGFSVDSLVFFEENPPGSGQLESTILSGKIRLPESSRQLEIREGEMLHMMIRQCQRLLVSQDTNRIRVRFEGLVAKLTAGVKRSEINYMPTYLEYVYHNQQMAFFWSCILFVWTLLWGVKNALVK
ncbi:MAG: hypothetical protein NTZ35_04055 [Ignavibacteriales bacterium]|nr:hypothetical protein [Ignavibacteriales bacterium]